MSKKIALFLLLLITLSPLRVTAADQYPANPVKLFATQSTVTSTLLAGNASYTGSWQNSSDGQKQLTVTAITAQSGSFVVQFSEDTAQTTYYQSSQTFLVTGGTVTTSPPIFIPTKYFRVVYTNGASAQTGTFEVFESLTQDLMNVYGTYNSTAPTLVNGQSTNLQLDANGYLNVHVQVGGSGGGGSTSTTTYPAVAPTPVPGTTGIPLYSNQAGHLLVAVGSGSQGTTSSSPLYATDPNNNSIAQDGSKNQGVYLAGSGQGSTISSPLYATDPNSASFNLDSNKDLITVGTGPGGQNSVIQSYQGGIEMNGSTAIGTTAVAISLTNPYYKIELLNYGTVPVFCNLIATATAGVTGGIYLPSGMTLPREIYWKTSAASTVSCIATTTGPTSVQVVAYR